MEEKSLIPIESIEKINNLILFCDSIQLIEIQNSDQYVSANDTYLKIGRILSEIEKERKEVKKPFAEQVKQIDTWFNQKYISVENLKKKLSPALSEWEHKERERQQAEQKRIDAITERERQEKEAAAQRERDKADALRKQAEELAIKDRAAADALLIRAAAADTRANVKEEAAANIQAPIIQHETPKVSTFTKANWKMRITNPQEFVKYCADNGLLFLLCPNEIICNNHAKIIQTETKYPGAEIYNDPIRSGKGNLPINNF
jgi:hypothetical protein